jgi:hypothetical protein
MGSDIGDARMVLHRCGKKAFEDFTTLDTVDCVWRAAPRLICGNDLL